MNNATGTAPDDDTESFKLALTFLSIAVLTFLSQTFTGRACRIRVLEYPPSFKISFCLIDEMKPYDSQSWVILP